MELNMDWTEDNASADIDVNDVSVIFKGNKGETTQALSHVSVNIKKENSYLFWDLPVVVKRPCSGVLQICRNRQREPL